MIIALHYLCFLKKVIGPDKKRQLTTQITSKYTEVES